MSPLPLLFRPVLKLNSLLQAGSGKPLGILYMWPTADMPRGVHCLQNETGSLLNYFPDLLRLINVVCFFFVVFHHLLFGFALHVRLGGWHESDRGEYRLTEHFYRLLVFIQTLHSCTIGVWYTSSWFRQWCPVLAASFGEQRSYILVKQFPPPRGNSTCQAAAEPEKIMVHHTYDYF